MIACAHRVARALEVKEHLADENAPALLRVAVLHLRQPTLYRRLVVLLAEQKLRRVSPLHILQHPYPVLHRRDAVRGQVIRLLTGGYFECGRAFSSVDPESICSDCRIRIFLSLKASFTSRSPCYRTCTPRPGLFDLAASD